MEKMLNLLAERQIKVSAEAGNLRILAPKGSITPEIRDLLKANKERLIALLDSQRPSPRPVVRPDRIPLSYTQRRFWVLDNLADQSHTYHMPFIAELQGRLCVRSLAKAVDRLVVRHEALRTVFPETEDGPVQVIQKRGASLTLVDLSSLPTATRNIEIDRIHTAQTTLPFDLEKGPLLRTTLVRESPQQHLFLMVLHHIVSDGWSLGVLYEELNQMYRDYLANRPPSLTPPLLQFADYALWQREQEQSDAYRALLNAWQQRLEDAPPMSTLPSDFTRPQVQGNSGADVVFFFPEAVAEHINNYCRSESVTLFIMGLSVLNLLVYRYTGQCDLVFGTPIANRPRTELEGLMGPFVNTLALRTQFHSTWPFQRLLEEVRINATNAFAGGEVPLDQLIERLNIERHTEFSPLFQIMFMVQNDPGGDLALPGLELNPLHAAGGAGEFDLTFSITDRDGSLGGICSYDSELFHPNSIDRLIAHFLNLFAAALEQPDTPLCLLPMTTSSERRQVISRFNKNARAFTGPACLHQLVEAAAAATPSATALVHGTTSLSYVDLNSRANQLAHALIADGLMVEDRVGILLNPSLDMVTAMLAVLKAGGVYVPLDTSMPSQRLRYQFTDSRVRLLLSRQDLMPNLGIAAEVPTFCVDRLATENQSLPCHNPRPALLGTNLAYLLYTSGSTGRPKGVAITHAAAVNLCHANRARNAYRSSDVVLQMASISFDVSVDEIFTTLAAGATLVLHGDRFPSPASLLHTLDHFGVTLLNTTPTLAETLALEAQSQERTLPEKLRLLVLGAEPLSTKTLKRIQAAGSTHTRILNVYGVSEATVDSCFADPATSGGNIGKPLTNNQIFLLDRWLNPVPIGVPGEMFIGGAGLARGYWQQPALTAERFIPNPHSEHPGDRLYRSGDGAIWTNDGDLIFQGRMDHQVKLRGFRIELGEIENALRTTDEVADAVVVLHQPESGNPFLAAYLRLNGTGSLSPDRLGERLREHVPAYTVPSYFKVLEQFPLTPTGKIDRNALPAPDREERSSDYRAPRSQVERELCTVWSELLGTEQVGIRDNFYALGGDSILAMQVTSRASARGLVFKPKDLFNFQTIERLAAHVVVRETVRASYEPVVGEAPLLPIQAAFFDQVHIDRHHYNQSALFETHIPIDAAALTSMTRAILAHHDALRSRFIHRDGTWLQRFDAMSEPLPCAWIDLSHLDEDERFETLSTRCATLQTQLSLDGPLAFLAYFHLGDQQPGRLFFAVHHLVVDGVSWRILVEDLNQILPAIHEQGPIQLPPKTTPVRDWALWQQDQGVTHFADQLDFWRAAEGRCQLPRDHHPAPEDITVAHERAYITRLDKAHTQILLRQVPLAYRTEINDVLLTAFLLAWHDRTGARELRLVLEGHGRADDLEDINLSRTVGWLTSNYPVRLRLPKEGHSFEPGQVLKSIKQQLHDIPDKGLGYGVLRWVNAAEGANVGGIEPAISFNYLGRFDEPVHDESVLRPATEWAGPGLSERQTSQYVLDINGVVDGDGLNVAFTYNERVHREESVAQLADAFLSHLQTLISHCAAGKALGVTPSDFPALTLTQVDLDRLVTHLSLPNGPLDGDLTVLEDIYPLSDLQRGMLHHSALEPESGVYNGQLIMELHGALLEDHLRTAWRETLQHHSVLRSFFVGLNEANPLQVVRGRVDPPWRVEDWRHLPEAERHARLQEQVHQDLHRPFPPDRAPLMRFLLVRTEDERHTLVWNHHHALIDGWSAPIVLQQVFGTYEARRLGIQPVWPVPRPYRDFITWIQAHDPVKARSFWRNYLAGFEEVTPLPRSAAANLSRTSDMATCSESFSAELTDGLMAFAAAQQITLNIVLKGLWGLLLGRYGNRRDVVFGTVFSGRPTELEGIETTVGPFIQNVPVRVSFSAEQTVADLLRQLQSDQADSEQYGYLGLSEIQRCSEVPGDRELFHSIFVFNQFLEEADEEMEREEPSLRVASSHAQEHTHYPLSIALIPGESLLAVAHFDRHQLAGERVQDMLARYIRLADRLVHRPTARVNELSPHTLAEREKLLRGWNDTVRLFPRETCLHQLVERHAARTPDAPALVFQDQELNYAQLNGLANQWARRLRALGLRDGDAVAVLPRQGTETLVAFLAILKAGGCYVPLDANFPKDRVTFMVDDSRAVLVLSYHRWAQLTNECKVPTFFLDQETVDTLADDDLNRTCFPNQAAQIMYTSGSTGRPKGAVLDHRAVIRLAATGRRFQMSAGDRVAQISSFAFDAATFEIWTALVHGAPLIGIPREVVLEPNRFKQALEHHRIDIMLVATALFNRIVNESPHLFAGVRVLLFGGEAAQPRMVRAVQQHGPPATLINAYGPTENSVIATWYELPAAAEPHGAIPIGLPIDNCQVHVLDQDMDLTLPGMIGQLWVGGIGLIQGYIGQPALTADRVRPNPFAEEPGARLYATGDLVTRREDGNLVFLERVDDQVKIRGHRVEIGEVELALRDLPGVAECLVVVRDEPDQTKQLVAYLVTTDGHEVQAGEVRKHLGEKLPDFMMPAHLILLGRFPLTPTGKVDRTSLPAPGQAARNTKIPAAAGGQVTATLLTLWQSVLGLDRVDPHQNFFELGGHSLLATQIIARIRDIFEVDLPLRTLYEAPTVTALEATLRTYRAHGLQSRPIEVIDRKQPLRLSFAQERLWFLANLDPASTRFSVSHILSLHGSLNHDALAWALTQLISRHEVLRTRFIGGEGEAHLEIDPAAPFDLKVVQVPHPSEDPDRAATRRVVDEENARPFDLAREPGFRAVLYRADEHIHELCFTVHHIISDGWSMNIMQHELGALYSARVQGIEPALPPVPLQFADFAAWERTQSDSLARQVDYWQAQLADAQPLDLVTDLPRPAEQTYHGAQHWFECSEELSHAVNAFCKANRVTPYVVLLTAYQILLARFSGQSDISVGTTAANRNRPETQYMLGFFANLLVIRTKLTGNFRSLVPLVQKTVLNALAHGDVPFQQVVARVQPDRDRSRSPLFQVNFVLQNADAPQEHLGDLADRADSLFHDLEVTPWAGGRPLALYDLGLYMVEQSKFLGMFLYNTDLFAPETIEDIACHFRFVLQELLDRPDQPIEQLATLSVSDQHRLASWNRTADAFPVGKTIHELFTLRAANHPQAPAMRDGTRTWTYGELESQSNRLARQLREQGVGLDHLVGICLERGGEMIVAMLAILKAGGAYVPLDPEYPEDRLSFLLEDAELAHLITDEKTLALLPAFPLNFIDSLIIDDPEGPWQHQVDDALDTESHPRQLAYVIYTSGSLGRQKGVAVLHNGVIRLTVGCSYVPLDETSRVAQASTSVFDACTFEIWGPLLNGGELIFVDKQTLLDSAALEQLATTTGIDTLFVTTALYNLLAQRQPTFLSGLRALLFGGEQVDPNTVRSLLAHGKPEHFLHMYGPTECTTYSSVYPIRELADEAVTVPIGRPIDGNSLHVLDEAGRPVPLGAVGELAIAGTGLARGYLRRPAMTAAAFIPNPFTQEHGERLYKTGDLVRWTADGQILFVRRADDQVKIRGFRIEPGEIEAAMLSHPEVRETFVMAHATEDGRKRLVAYWIGDEQAELTPIELRVYLNNRLPEYLIPSAFIRMDAFPLNTNGKVDRKALPEPDDGGLALQSEFIAPRDSREQLLADAWKAAIKLERVGIHDNYFELGGDSLLAIKVKALVQEAGFDFELVELFTTPTVAELAAKMNRDRTQEELAAFALIPEQDRAKLPAEVEDAYPMSYLQRGMIFHGEYETHIDLYHEIISYQLALPFDQEALARTLADLTRRHEILRTGFELDGYSDLLQLVYRDVSIPMEVIDWRQLDEQEQARQQQAWIEEERHRPFVWQQAPMMRVFIHLLSDHVFQFGYSTHHIVWDGWSESMLTAELLDRYQTYLRGETPSIDPLKAKFRDFIALEQHALRDPVAKTFWAKATTDLPVVGLGRGPRQDLPDTDDEGFQELHISDRVAADTVALANRLGVSLKAVTLAAHFKVLSLWTGSRDVVTGLVTNGRPETGDGDKVLGMFLNSLPLRFTLRHETWSDLIRRTQTTERAMLPHRRFPMVEIAKLGGHSRGFEMLFNYTHFHAFEEMDETGNLILERNGFAGTSLPISVDFGPTPGGFSGLMIYQKKAYDAELVAAMAALYLQVIETMVAEPEAPHWRRDFLSEQASQQLLGWSSNPSTVSPDCLHRRFENMALEHPHRPAIIAGPETRTFAEFNRQANRLAHFLLRQGLAPEARVGVCLARSPRALVAMMAVLKAGGSYVPLDPAYPPPRLHYFAKNGGVSVILTESDTSDHWQGENWAQVTRFSMDDILAECAGLPAHNPIRTVHPEQLAYIIHTSGSTGMPKGVAISHRAVVNLCDGIAERNRITPNDRVLQLASTCFDVSVDEIFTTLLTGAAVVLPPAGLLDGRALVDQINTQKISILNMTPTYADQLASYLEQHDCPPPDSLRLLVLGAEALSKSRLARFTSVFGQTVRLLNVYGVTEACVDSSYADPELGSGGIGRPMPNVDLRVLDDYLHPTPAWVSGELFIAGTGLARGYLGQPAWTAERFLPDPHGEQPGGRMYRTGDQCVWHAEGDLHFRGRVDDQVKIRGYRIELGEIETTLEGWEEVAQAHVISREDRRGMPQLVAYLRLESDEPADPDDLKTRLSKSLPSFMVPSHFQVLEHFPLTPGGKVDRQALPAPKEYSSETYAAAGSETERLLVEIWGQLLNLDRVGIHDNFFGLGGDSILSMQVTARASALGLSFTPRDLFETQTIAALAQRVTKGGRQLARQDMILGDIPLIPVQRDMFDYVQVDRHHFNQSMMLTLTPPSEPSWLPTLTKTLLSHHDMLRAHFDRDGTSMILGGLPHHLPCTIVDIATDADWQARLETQAQHYQASLALSGPLCRLVYFDLAGRKDGRLLIAVHHQVVDGVSWRILLEDIATILDQIQANRPPQLPAKTAAFLDWANWVNGESALQRFRDEQAYWAALGLERRSELPLDFAIAPGEANYHHTDTVEVHLDADATRDLTRSVHDAYRTRVDDLLLAALAMAHRDWNGADHLLLALEHHGRHDDLADLDLSRTVGWFTTVYPLLLVLGNEQEPGTLIKSIKEQVRATPHSGLGFGILRHLDSESGLRHVPFPQISFNYLGRFETGSEIADGPTQAVESAGSPVSNDQEMPFLLDINGAISDARCYMSFIYSTKAFRRETVARFAGRFLQCLQALIAHCRDTRIGGLTPSDVPLAQVDQPVLDRTLAATRVPASSIEDIYPLAPAQFGMLYHTLLAPESSVYSGQMVFHLKGSLDVPLLIKAWEDLQARHPLLRTLFVGLDEALPMQVVLKHAPLPWVVEDWRDLDEATQAAHFQNILQDDYQRPFDLNRAPLMRLLLVHLGEANHRLVWTCHHALTDGWSLPIVVGEMFTRYHALVEGRALALPVARPYRDYIAWLTQQDPDEASSFWREYLAGFAHTTPLDNDQPPIGQAPAIQTQYFHFSVAASRGLETFAREHRLTVNILLQLAWALQLLALSGFDDVVFGTVVSGRTTALNDIEHTVGPFVQTLPVRLRIDRAHRLIDLAHHLMETQVRRESFGHLPLAEIRNCSEQPIHQELFHTLFVFLNYPVEQSEEVVEAQSDGLELTAIDAQEQTHYPLTLTVQPGESLTLMVQYDSQLFDEAGIERRIRDYQALVERLVGEPACEVGDLFPTRSEPALSIRGFRVQPAQIAALLAQHESVSEAFVRPYPHPESEQLGAWCIPTSCDSFDEKELRLFLEDRLAEFCIPRSFSVVQAWPRTGASDIDPAALPHLAPEFFPSDADYTAPRYREETLLAQTFAETLGVSRVGIHDDFFALGGSLPGALWLVHQLAGHGYRLPLPLLCADARCATLAKVLRARDEAPQPFQSLSNGERRALAGRAIDAFPAIDPNRLFPAPRLARLFRISLPFHADLARSALDDLTLTHELLRSAFHTGEGRPLHLIRTDAAIPLDICAVDSLGVAAQTQATDRHPVHAIAAPLDEDQFVFGLALHPALATVLDETALTTSWQSVYETALEDLVPVSPVSDTVVRAWSLTRIANRARDEREAEHFWATMLDEAETFRFEHTESPSLEQTQPHEELLVTLPEAMYALAGDWCLPLEDLLLACHLKALAMMSGCNDPVTLLTVMPQGSADVHAPQPLWPQVVPLRLDQGSGTWLDLVEKVSAMRQACTRHALAGVTRTLHSEPRSEILFEGLSQPSSWPRRAYPLGLSFVLNSDHRVSTGILRVEPSRREAAAQLLLRLETVFQAMLAAPDRAHGATYYLDPRAQRILAESNRTHVIRSEPMTLHQAFEAAVARHPDRLAIEDDTTRLTYRELNQGANQLARTFLAGGMTRGQIVGIHLDRSPRTLVAILAIFKAGGAYLPLAPEYPTARLNQCIQEAKPAFVITDASLQANLAIDGPTTILLDDLPEFDELDRDNPNLDADGADPAYVIYTSGSTGTPKGIIGHHAGILNRLQWMWRAYPYAEDEVMVHKTSLSFADSIWELFGGLLRGVPTRCISRESTVDPHQLVNHLAKASVSRIVLVPSLLQTLLDHVDHLGDRLPALHTWTTSGEALPSSVAAAFHRALPGRKLLNLYGATEVSADVLASDIPADCRHITIGRPIDNCRYHVLDTHLHPVDVGIPGDLYLAGAALAHGYLGQPATTAVSFLPNPHADTPGERLYRSGDLASYDQAGTLTYLGRRDHQVKLRGYRIELGEVREVMLRHPHISDGTVTFVPSLASGPGLVAYFVTNDLDTARNDLRAWLSERLPDFMVPAVLVPLDALPLNPNGKLDTRALPDPDLYRNEIARTQEPPATDIQISLAEIWMMVLELPSLGIHDNFFELGGNSLSSNQVVAEIRRRFGVELSLRAFFDRPTIARLEEFILDLRIAAMDDADLAAALAEIEGITDEEAQSLLDNDQKILDSTRFSRP